MQQQIPGINAHIHKYCQPGKLFRNFYFRKQDVFSGSYEILHTKKCTFSKWYVRTCISQAFLRKTTTEEVFSETTGLVDR